MTRFESLPSWIDVSRETFEKLEFYASELIRWNKAINLISKQSEADIWNRHIWDSAQLFTLARASSESWADLGSGGGLPGIVLAILGQKNMILVESDNRKAAFLRQISARLDLDVKIESKRIERLEPLGVNNVSSRALAKLTDLLAYTDLHVKPGGKAWFQKGVSIDQEIESANQIWRYDIEKYMSKTDPHACILCIQNLTEIGKKT